MNAQIGYEIIEDPEFAPLFTLQNTDGKMVSLDSYKGKVVYLSFWATWCKPCLSGFFKTKEIRAELTEMGVILMNVSLDKDPDLWRTTMDRVPMPGVNLLGNTNVQAEWQLYKLPAYFIVDKTGRLAYLSGETTFQEDFRRLLKQ